MSLPSYFNRVRHLDSSRDELALLLFLQVPLRSREGRSAIQNMIRIYQEIPKVAYRPSLRPENGRCPEATCSLLMESFVTLSKSQPPNLVIMATCVLAKFRQPTDGIMSFSVERCILKSSMALQSYAFSATNRSPMMLNGKTTANNTSIITKSCQHNLIKSSIGTHLQLQLNTCFAFLIRNCLLPSGTSNTRTFITGRNT